MFESFELLRKSFRKKSGVSEETESLFLKRARASHMIIMATRALNTTLGQSFWQKTMQQISEQQPGQETALSYDGNFYNNYVEPSAASVMYSMLAVGVLLDLASLWKRKAAYLLFGFECVLLLLEGFVPIDYGKSEAFVVFLWLLGLQGALGCHSGPNILVSAVIYFALEFI